MADYSLYTQEAANAKADVVKTSLALSKLRLYQDTLTPSALTTRAQLEAAECDFDGYPAGGYPIAAVSGPINAPGGGAMLTTPLTNVIYGPPGTPPVGNMVGGWWIEDATPAVRLVGVFNPSKSCNGPGDGFSIVQQIIEAMNPAPTGS